MAGDTTLALIGDLTADPDLRLTPSGAAVATFAVASTPRTFDRQSGHVTEPDREGLVWLDATDGSPVGAGAWDDVQLCTRGAGVLLAFLLVSEQIERLGDPQAGADS